MCNYYARTLSYPSTPHAFDTKAERDAWVDEKWDYRDTETAEYAFINAEKSCIVLHGHADIPRSWRKRRVWDYKLDGDEVIASIEYRR